MKQRFAVFIVVIASLIAAQCGGTPPTEAPTATEVPPTEAPATEEAPTTLDGKSLLQERCTRCHGLGGGRAGQEDRGRVEDDS